uniref:60S ribosome subunit biogenesis protein NIP7 pre-PUA domain-containing protein n=1 Tax=Amphiprion percula TaxID=161767 RepID=A0A3P8U0K3_AMPPE
MGENRQLVDRPDSKILKLATKISRDKLISVGTYFGKFTKTKKFCLHNTALDFLAPYAKSKVPFVHQVKDACTPDHP